MQIYIFFFLILVMIGSAGIQKHYLSSLWALSNVVFRESIAIGLKIMIREDVDSFVTLNFKIKAMLIEFFVLPL
jgi:hypothetical protein